jgi:hypothetical protein
MRMRWVAEAACVALTWTSLLASMAFADQPDGGREGMLTPDAVETVGQVSPPNASKSKLDPELVVRGESAFMVACTSCHDAQRALQKSKSFSGWMSTVRRMAGKDGASIEQGDIEPIAAYLASLGQDTATAKDSESSDGIGATSFATIAPLFRGGDDRPQVENPGFFADAWFGMEFTTRTPLRGNVTLCTSCHSQNQAYSVEVVELSATLDLKRWLCPCDLLPLNIEANVKAGRFVVPFGGYSAMSHPGVYRTLTNPLMFDMGRRVFGNVGPPRQPVLPLPYADEGVNLHTQLSLFEDGFATFDLYGVNGLQEASFVPGGGVPSVFFTSRSYTDNNSRPALGGRVTVGNPLLRFGGSLMVGDYQKDGDPQRRYQISGVDVTASHRDLGRFYFEYAVRDEDAFGSPGLSNKIYGTVTEAEIPLLSRPRIGLLGRYDTLRYRDTFGPNAGINRLTWGLTAVLPDGSLLIVNHEHWMFPAPQSEVDVVGARWVTTF